jgi:hypothetical protein
MIAMWRNAREYMTMDAHKIPNPPINVSYSLVGLGAAKYPGDETTEAMARFVAQYQQADGSWRSQIWRPPVKLRARMRIVFALLAAAPALAQSVALSSLTPISLVTHPAGQNYAPAANSVTVGTRKWNALRFIGMSDVTYAIPSGMRSFSATIIWGPTNHIPAPTGDPTDNQLRVRLLLDGAIAHESCLDDVKPPEQISIELNGAQTLDVSSLSQFSGGVFYLANAVFQATDAVPPSPVFLPDSGAAFLDAAPLPRQALFHTYHQGETVPLTLYYNGMPAVADVRITVTPEAAWLDPVENEFQIDLTSTPAATWQAPNEQGPAQLEIAVDIGGNTVFTRSLRIAVAPAVDLSTISDASINIHTNWNSWLTLLDDFANLYNPKWGRILLDWQAIEATTGTYDFSGADQLVASYNQQNIRIMAMLGERWPSWAGNPGPAYNAAWAKFVAAAVARYRGKIDAYDLFNEVDVKQNTWVGLGIPDQDIPLLQGGINAVRASDPNVILVCCSTGTYDWMNYQKKLADAGILAQVDISSTHPYPTLGQPPEVPDGLLNHLSDADELLAVSAKQPWFTEENWILGPPGASGVTNPNLTEHDQARYTVRAGFLAVARGMKYFLHSPFEQTQRPELHLDTLAAYAQAASFFATASSVALATPWPDLWVLTANDPFGYTIGAVWTTGPSGGLALTGESWIELLDMYGNPYGADPSNLTVVQDPVYFFSPSPVSVQSANAPAEPNFVALPTPDKWKQNKTAQYAYADGVMQVTSGPAAVYDHMLDSPAIPVEPNTCYIFQANAKLDGGAAQFIPDDAATGANLAHGIYLQYSALGLTRPAQTWFNSGKSTAVTMVFSAANGAAPKQSQIELSQPQMATCP